MAGLFKIKKQIEENIASKPLTRFKRVHVRDRPVPERDDGIDPLANFTRTERTHVRKVPERISDKAPSADAPERPKRQVDADLHATEAISIDVLRKALPSRFSET